MLLLRDLQHLPLFLKTTCLIDHLYMFHLFLKVADQETIHT